MSDASLGTVSTCWRSRVKAKRVNQCYSVVDAQAAANRSRITSRVRDTELGRCADLGQKVDKSGC